MSDFNTARKNMIHNQLMTNNITEDYILKAFEVIPREIFLPYEKKAKAYLDEDIEIFYKGEVEYSKKDFSALLDYACELAGIKPPRI